jgi:hypothetical protein
MKSRAVNGSIQILHRRLISLKIKMTAYIYFVILFCFLFNALALANPTLYSDRAQWEVKVSNITTETFDSGFVKVTPSPISEKSGPIIQPVTFESPLFVGKMVQDYSLSEVPGKTKTSVTYSLVSQATAFGFNINPQSTTTYDIRISFGDESIGLVDIVPLGQEGFVGVTTDAQSFKAITFTLDNSKATKTTNFFYIMDNLSFGTAQ